MSEFFATKHPDQAQRLFPKSYERLKVIETRVQPEWSEFAASAQLLAGGADAAWWAEGFEMQVVVMFTEDDCGACDCVGGKVQRPLFTVMEDNGDWVRYYPSLELAFKGIAECEKEYRARMADEGIVFD